MTDPPEPQGPDRVAMALGLPGQTTDLSDPKLGHDLPPPASPTPPGRPWSAPPPPASRRASDGGPPGGRGARGAWPPRPAGGGPEGPSPWRGRCSERCGNRATSTGCP